MTRLEKGLAVAIVVLLTTVAFAQTYVASDKTVGFKSDTMWASRVLDDADHIVRGTKHD